MGDERETTDPAAEAKAEATEATEEAEEVADAAAEEVEPIATTEAPDAPQETIEGEPPTQPDDDRPAGE